MNAKEERERMKRIPDDEPCFVLRAQDATAAIAVEAWADLAERLGVHEKKVNEARRQACRMRAWCTRKLPD